MNRNQRRRIEKLETRTQAMAGNRATHAMDSLNEEQVAARLVAALGVGGPFTEDDAARAMEWRNEVSVGFALLELVMNGLVSMTWDKQEQDWKFKRLDGEQARDLIRLAEAIAK